MSISGVVPAPTMAGALSRLHFTLDDVASLAPSAGGDVSQLRAVERAVRRLEAVKLVLIAQADRERAAEPSAHTSTASLVDQVTRSGGAAASAQVSLALALEESCPQTKAALADGAVTTQAAAIIVGALEKLPAAVTDAERAKVEAGLVRDAKFLDVGRLRRTATRALAAAERSSAEVDAHQDELLRSREERAYAASRLTLHDNGDGTTSGRFTVPTLAASMLRKVIQSMTAPRRDHGRAATGNSRSGVTDFPGLPSVANSPGSCSAAGGPGLPSAAVGFDSLDTDSVRPPHSPMLHGGSATPSSGPLRDDDWRDLSWQERAGRALVDLLEHLPTDQLSSKNAATLVVTTELETLREGVRAASVECGIDISASEVRRLACAAGLVPAVLDGESLPLDIGRQQRHFTQVQRTALASIYDSCAAADCDRPYSWCELHHDQPWHRDGRTDLRNAIPLCGFHHRLIDNPSYRSTVRRHGPRAEVRFTRRT